MRVLIFTSEPLNPADTLPSTFELSQAKLLSRICDVAICSVRQSTGPAVESQAGSTLGSRARRTLRRILGLLQRFRRPEVRRHVIDGVTVFEGVAASGDGRFNRDLACWVRAATAAFAACRRTVGAPDVIHAHGRFLNAGAAALAIHRATRIPYVYTDHSSAYQRGFAPAEAEPVLREVIANAAEYSTVSPALAEAVDGFLGGPVREARVMPNVIDPLFEQTPPRPPPAAPPYVFLNIASLNFNKGVDRLIHAFARAFAGQPGYQLEICGDGELRNDLESLVSGLGLRGQVHLLGKLSKAQVLERLDRAHALVLASQVETFGVVLIEALARGRPVVATRCGGPEGIVTSSNGLLTPRGDVDALAEALRTMADNAILYDSSKLRDDAIAAYGEAAFLKRALDIYRAAA